MIDPELSLSEDSDMSTHEGRLFKKDPAINVISKEDFEDRVDKVFYLLWKTLSLSFGPYGAPSIISNYPYSHVTKDGYTIQKNLSMDASETKLDQAIALMADEICGRLNYSVGDGTTTAIIATYSIYKAYRQLEDALRKEFILPRDIIKCYNEFKGEIIKRLKAKVKPINSTNMDELADNIRDVVYISSNGDDLITDYITDLYRELGVPAITCMLAPDGVTKKRLITGYKYDLCLTDRIYINNDDDTAAVKEADVIIFGVKVTAEIYNKIIKPLANISRLRNRHLIVAAINYDTVALQQTIAVDLNNEFDERKDVTAILTVYKVINENRRKLASDFATLMDTYIIDRPLCEQIIDNIDLGNPPEAIFNIDDRDIEGLGCVAATDDGRFAIYRKGVDELPENLTPIEKSINHLDNKIRLGYTRDCKLGLQTSQFNTLIYDKSKYELHLKDAEHDLEEKEAKYQKLGTFNLEVSQAQQRLYALRLKMGIIEVGADSELSQKLLKDAVDDAVRAAASAYKHGVVLGCNVNLLQVILDIYKDIDLGSTKGKLIKILFEGFLDVYRTVLGNAFEDVTVTPKPEQNHDKVMAKLIGEYSKIFKCKITDIFENEESFNEAAKFCLTLYGELSLHNVIILYSIRENKVFDLSKRKFTDSVINSAQTDIEVLTATVDLIGLLIVGNQMIVTGKHNF